MPVHLFIVCILLCFALFITLGFITSFVFFIVFIPPLIIVHADDEKGLVMLFDKLFRASRYDAGIVDNTSFKVIKNTYSNYDITSF